MRFHILTLFPKIFDSYMNESILKRAQQKKLITIKTHNIRDYTTDKHHTTDDKPYGGGAGMVMKAEPILRAIKNIEHRTQNIERRTRDKEHRTTKVVLLSAKGKQFTQQMAYDWSRKYDELIFISGRYEGIDERVKTILRAEEISIGPYVTTDGDVAAMVIVSTVARLLPGVIRLESLAEESHWHSLLKEEVRLKDESYPTSSRKTGLRRASKLHATHSLEYPHYTRPEKILWKGKRYSVPKVLLRGDHKKIKAWRELRRKLFRGVS